MLIKGIESVTLSGYPTLYLRTEDADALQADFDAASAAPEALHTKYAALALTEETVIECATLQMDAEQLLQEAEAVRNS